MYWYFTFLCAQKKKRVVAGIRVCVSAQKISGEGGVRSLRRQLLGAGILQSREREGAAGIGRARPFLEGGAAARPESGSFSACRH